MIVPVSLVRGMAVAIVQVVNVIAVWNGNVAAALAVLVVMILVDVVLGGFALVPVAFVLAVDVAIVGVVGVVAVLEGNVAATFAVGVGMLVMNGVAHGFSLGSMECFQSVFI